MLLGPAPSYLGAHQITRRRWDPQDPPGRSGRPTLAITGWWFQPTNGKRTSMQGGAPPVISWFIIPINYRYNPHKP